MDISVKYPPIYLTLSYLFIYLFSIIFISNFVLAKLLRYFLSGKKFLSVNSAIKSDEVFLNLILSHFSYSLGISKLQGEN